MEKHAALDPAAMEQAIERERDLARESSESASKTREQAQEDPQARYACQLADELLARQRVVSWRFTRFRPAFLHSRIRTSGMLQCPIPCASLLPAAG
jgi:hypothetical protein